MHEVLVNRLEGLSNRLGGLSLPRKSVVRLTDRPDMTLDVYCGRKTIIQQQQHHLEKTLVLQRKCHDVSMFVISSQYVSLSLGNSAK